MTGEVIRHAPGLSAPDVSKYLNERPDWVMVGAPWHDGGVMILASKSLDRAVLEYAAEVEQPDFLGPLYMTSQTIKVEVYMQPNPTIAPAPGYGEAFVIVTAPTYGEALQALLKHWSPDNTATQLLPEEIEE